VGYLYFIFLAKMSIATAIKASAGRNGGGGENKGGGSSKMQGVAALGNAAGAVGASTASFAVAYSVEDTQDGSYRDVGAHLTRKFGWTAVPYRRPQKGAAGSRWEFSYFICIHLEWCGRYFIIYYFIYFLVL
jgi:hypothetical protein